MKFNRCSLSGHGAALLTLCLLPAGNLLAQELELPSQDIVASPIADVDGYQAKRASTASKSSVALKDEAQSVQVVTPQTIEDFQPNTLDDALKFVSGISQGNTLGNTRDALIKRGFGNNSDGSVLRDGVRSNLSRSFGATTERVEVLKGPASLLYGALEPGGLINVISKQPQYVQRTKIGGTAFGEGGGSLSLDTTGPLGDSGLAYRLVAERQSRDYWRNYGVDQHTLVAPSLSWVGERASLTLAYEYNDYSTPFDRGTVFVDGHPADIDYDKRLGEKWEGNEGIGESASARFEYELSDAWKTRLSYAWNNDRYDLAIAQPVSLSGNQLLRTANGGQYDYETRYASLDFIGQQRLFGQTHELLLGIDNEVNDNFRGTTYRNPNGTRRNIDIHNPHYGDLGEPSVVDVNRSNMRNELTSTSLYLKDNWHLNQQWIVVLGGRYQHYDQYKVQGLAAERKPSLDSNDQTFIPFAGLVYKLDDTLSLYGNYSRSFMPNTTVDDRNSVFDPEEGRSYEVGAKYDLNPNLSLNLALFDIVKKNVVTNTNVGGLSISEAAGKVGSRGVEVDLTGRLAERWQMIATYAYTHTEILDDPKNEGNRLTQAPRQSASLYLTHHLRTPESFGQWRLGAGTRYVGARAGDNENSYYMSSYTVSDAFLRWDLPTRDYGTRLQLNVDNLFDKHYYPSSTGSPLQVNVGQPRSLRLSASVEF